MLYNMYKQDKNKLNIENSDKEKHKACTYEEIRDIVLDKKAEVKKVPSKNITSKNTPQKKKHNFEFV